TDHDYVEVVGHRRPASLCEPRPDRRCEPPFAAFSCEYYRRILSAGSAPTGERRSPMRSDIVPGGIFPDYRLPDHTGTLRTLSELQGHDPMILTLSRGHYCPKEHQQHLELAAFQSKIAVAYTRIVTIATDDHHTLQEFRQSVGASWPFLSDPE